MDYFQSILVYFRDSGHGFGLFSTYFSRESTTLGYFEPISEAPGLDLGYFEPITGVLGMGLDLIRSQLDGFSGLPSLFSMDLNTFGVNSAGFWGILVCCRGSGPGFRPILTEFGDFGLFHVP